MYSFYGCWSNQKTLFLPTLTKYLFNWQYYLLSETIVFNSKRKLGSYLSYLENHFGVGELLQTLSQLILCLYKWEKGYPSQVYYSYFFLLQSKLSSLSYPEIRNNTSDYLVHIRWLPVAIQVDHLHEFFH